MKSIIPILNCYIFSILALLELRIDVYSGKFINYFSPIYYISYLNYFLPSKMKLYLWLNVLKPNLHYL